MRPGRGHVRLPFLLAEVGQGLRRNLSLTVALVVSVAVSLSLLGVALLLGKQVEVNKDYWYDRVEVSVFLCGAASPATSCPAGAVTAAEREDVAATLRALPEVSGTAYESSEQAYARARAIPDLQVLTESVTAQAMPESFRVTLHDPRRYEAVARALAGRPGVEAVEDQERLLEPLFGLLGTLRTGALLVALVQLAATVLLVTNTVRLGALHRRRETGIKRLVGASRTSITLPFVLEGAVAGLLGALAACGLLVLGYRVVVVDWLGPRLPAFRYVGWPELLGTLPLLVGLGVVGVGLASLASLARHVRG